MKSVGLKLSGLGLFSLLFLGFNTAYADNLCDDPTSAHCAQMNGDKPHNVFKNIKIELITDKPPVSAVVCANNTLGTDLYADDINNLIQGGYIKSFPTKLEYRYYQCNNASCDQNRLLGADKFVLSKIGDDSYSSNPQSYNIPVFDNNYGESCVPSGKIKSLLHMLLSSHKSQ